jgi:hypothetical protein
MTESGVVATVVLCVAVVIAGSVVTLVVRVRRHRRLVNEMRVRGFPVEPVEPIERKP